MVRIPLSLNNQTFIEVSVHVRAHASRIGGVVKFFVDTGSPVSLLTEEDAQRLQIPTTRLTFDKIAYIGGTHVNEATIRDVTLTFKDADGNPHKIHSDEFLVIKNMRSGSKSIGGVPSILGNDFLLKNRLSLHVDPSRNEAYYLAEP